MPLSLSDCVCVCKPQIQLHQGPFFQAENDLTFPHEIRAEQVGEASLHKAGN